MLTTMDTRHVRLSFLRLSVTVPHYDYDATQGPAAVLLVRLKTEAERSLQPNSNFPIPTYYWSSVLVTLRSRIGHAVVLGSLLLDVF